MERRAPCQDIILIQLYSCVCVYVRLKEAMGGEIWKTFSLYWFVLCMCLKFIGLCVYACVHVLISMAKPRSERLPFLDLSVFLPTHDQI